jgi:hypothetical protein
LHEQQRADPEKVFHDYPCPLLRRTPEKTHDAAVVRPQAAGGITMPAPPRSVPSAVPFDPLV